jgi:hypothetical protein
MFTPHVLEEEGGSSYYGYGWVVLDSDYGPVAWHNGGNAWSYGEFTRLLGRDHVMAFWVTNRVRAGEWNFNRLGQPLTRGVVERVRG